MSQSKIIISTALLCLLFCTTELFALGSNPEKQKTTFSLDGIVQSFDGAVNGIGNSLDKTVNGLGKSIDGAMNGIGKSLDGAVVDLGVFLEDTEDFAVEVIEVAIVVGEVILYVIAEDHCYYYDYGYNHSHYYY